MRLPRREGDELGILHVQGYCPTLKHHECFVLGGARVVPSLPRREKQDRSHLTSGVIRKVAWRVSRCRSSRDRRRWT
jgi:hypothetical protein